MTEQKRFFHIRVTKGDADEKVNITLPLGLAKLARVGGIATDLSKRYDVDLDSILKDIETMPDGKIVDVIDEKTDEHVEIFIESRRVAPEPVTADSTW